MSQLEFVARNSEVKLSNSRLAMSLVGALADKFAKEIMMATLAKPKTIQEISAEKEIPLSTCYRRMQHLVDEGLMIVDRIVITNDGKKYATYTCTFADVTISLHSGNVSARVHVNEQAADKFRNFLISANWHTRT